MTESLSPRRKALAAFAVGLGSSIMLARTSAAQTKTRVEDGVYADDFGNVSVDAGAAIVAAFASGARRVKLRSTTVYNCTTSPTIPDYCMIEGALSSVGLSDSIGSYAGIGSQLVLGSGVTINVGYGANIKQALIARAGLTLPATTLTTARALPATFSGTAVTFAGGDASIDDCIILGFAQAVSSIGFSRPKARRIRFDCTNGIDFEGGYDIGRIVDCQGWPYTTAGIAPGGDQSLRRGGTAFKFKGACDWSSGEGNFAYGYAYSFVRDGSDNITWERCQSDYTNPSNGSDGGLASVAGFWNTNAVSYARDEHCTVVAGTVAVLHESTLVNRLGGHLTVSDGFYAGGENIKVTNVGGVDMSGNKFYSGISALNVTSTTCSGVTIRGNYPGGMNPNVFIVPSGVPFTKIANFLEPGNAAVDTLPDTVMANFCIAPPNAAGSLTIASLAAAGGAGPEIDFTGPVFNTDNVTTQYITFGGIRPYVVTPAGAGSAIGMKLSISLLGVKQDVLQIDHAGNITAGTYTGSQNYFGTPGTPWPIANITTLSVTNFGIPYIATPTSLPAGRFGFDGTNLFIGTGSGVKRFVAS